MPILDGGYPVLKPPGHEIVETMRHMDVMTGGDRHPMLARQGDAMIHPSAIVDDGANIGENCRVWHFVHV